MGPSAQVLYNIYIYIYMHLFILIYLLASAETDLFESWPSMYMLGVAMGKNYKHMPCAVHSQYKLNPKPEYLTMTCLADLG